METLNEDDLDWLTRVENRLLSMQKREAANTKSYWVTDTLKKTIGETHQLRQALQSRFNKKVDADI